VSETIICRARISQACQHDWASEDAYGEDEQMRDDGTWDGETVVCTPCYVVLMPYTPSGRGLTEELPDAIEAARIRKGLS